MARKIILLSDGTGNSAAKVWRTNVWRVFESIDLSGNNQIAFYDDGVGTASFKPLALLGGGFGWGLKRNIVDLYKFASRNYRDPEDEIFGFGFSRGAFTIRVLTGLILEQGLVQADSEEELHRKAVAAYRAFRANNFKTFIGHERIFRAIRDALFSRHYDPSDNRKNINVRFLGLWDSVAAYGLPIEEMTRGFSQYVWPWIFPDCELHPDVKRACHALAIDDERTTFHPVLWDERKELPLAPRAADGKRYLADERVSQVWFAGVHSNVGGGYPDDSLAHIPLVWIMSEAQLCGLQFKSAPQANPQTHLHPDTVQDKDGRLYDPRSGLGGYYRYGPRDILRLGEKLLLRKGQTTPVVPKIHESVLRRVRNHAHAYAPLGLPGNYDLVTPDGVVLPPADNLYEVPAQAGARWNIQERVWDLIWLRRILYFITLFVTLYLLIYPLFHVHDSQIELTSRFSWLSDLIRIAEAFLPGFASTWTDAYAQGPIRFLIVAAVVIVLLWLSARMSLRIQSRLEVVWRNSVAGGLTDPGTPTTAIYRFRRNPTYIKVHAALKQYILPAFFAVILGILCPYILLASGSHALFKVSDVGGQVCSETGTTNELRSGEIVVLNAAGGFTSVAGPSTPTMRLPVFRTTELCQNMGVRLERNARYRITFESTASFKDGDLTNGAAEGFYSSEARPLWKIPLMYLGAPFLREWSQPWFRVIARIGATGGDDYVLMPDRSDPAGLINVPLRPRRDGELFLFVNDAVVGIPGFGNAYKFFYDNNQGSTRVTITRF